MGTKRFIIASLLGIAISLPSMAQIDDDISNFGVWTSIGVEKKISKKLKKRVVMFQYPLFPEVDPNITVKFIRKIMDFYKFENITFMGDSAGANLCMYILRSLHQDDINIIKKIVLISPFVEGSMNNAHISLISSYDFILDVDNCKKMCEQLYSIYLKDGEKLFPQSNEFKLSS